MRPARRAPVSLHSIAFAYDGAPDAILLRDHVTGQLVSVTPEWSAADGDRALAAYVRGAQPRIQVVLSRPQNPGSLGDWAPRDATRKCTVYATGAGGPGIEQERIRLRFDENGLSAPIELRLSRRLPDRTGRLHLRWRWRVRFASQEFTLGTSSHEICLTARRILDPATWLGRRKARRIGRDAAGARWTYSSIMEWTCQWAAGLDDDKAIVDAIMRNLPTSGLKYAVLVNDIRDMLVQGGGYCGLWARMFQAMAASMGVQIERRGILVDWRVGSNPRRELWRALVVRSGGINRAEPTWPVQRFRDAGVTLKARTAIVTIAERRYVFQGKPYGHKDGHVFNVLAYRGSRYLYDPSFLLGPIQLDRPLPRRDVHRRKDVANLGNFHRAYLSKAVDHMLGTLPWGSHRHTTKALTIPTALLNSPGTLTFFWV